jgi:hypothetical protein
MAMWGQPPSAVRRSEAPRAFLLLEQVIERRPRIVGSRARRRRCFLLARHPHFIRRTLVPRVLLRHSLLDRLHALEAAAGIEIHALLARMQFKSALRTPPVRRHSLQHRAALGASRNRSRPRHIHRPRAKRVIALRWWCARFLSRSLALASLAIVAILISRLTILSHRILPSTWPVLSTHQTPPGKCLARLSS